MKCHRVTQFSGPEDIRAIFYNIPGRSLYRRTFFSIISVILTDNEQTKLFIYVPAAIYFFLLNFNDTIVYRKSCDGRPLI